LGGRLTLGTGAGGGSGGAIYRRLALDVAGIAGTYGSNTGSAEPLAAEIVSASGTAQRSAPT
jgi:hypothetical protein